MKRLGFLQNISADIFGYIAESFQTFFSGLKKNFHHKQNRKKIEITFANTQMGMALLTSKWRCVRVNSALCRLLGFTPKELFHLDFQRIISPTDFNKSLTQIKKLLDGDIDFLEARHHFLEKNGDTILMQVNKSVVRDKKNKFLYFILQVELSQGNQDDKH